MASMFGPVEDLHHLPGHRSHATQDKEGVSHEGREQGGGGEGDEESGQQELEEDQQDASGGRCQSCRRTGKVERHLNAKGAQKCGNTEHQKDQQKSSGKMQLVVTVSMSGH